MNHLLQVQGVYKTYRVSGRKIVHALRNVSFSLDEGRCLGIVGESGCGKSTLCRIISGAERPDTGMVLYGGRPVRAGENRGRIQMVFQNSMDSVNPRLDIYHIIAEPLENLFHMTAKERRIRAGQLMEQVGLSSEDLKKYPRQFSGGQLQRICIARALAAKPGLLILDEPLSSLDVSVQAQILNLLADLKKETGMAYVLISHDLKAVYYLADELAVMYEGQIVEQIETMDLFDSLCHPYTRRLLDAHKIEIPAGTG